MELEALDESTLGTLRVIAHCGSETCVDRALRLYLCALPKDERGRMRRLEELSYRFLVENHPDERIDVVYGRVISRINEFGLTAGARRDADHDAPRPF